MKNVCTGKVVVMIRSHGISSEKYCYNVLYLACTDESCFHTESRALAAEMLV